ncbi:MAG: ABC transporter ATP-binding protein [Bdellovibrionales bacterium]
MAHHFFTEDNVAHELTFKTLFLKLWPYLWRHKRKVFTSLALVLSFVVLGRALPFLFGYAVDHGIKGGARAVIVYVAIAYLLLESLRAVLAFLQIDYIQRFGNQVLFEIRDRLISHVQRLPVTYFEKNPSGRTVTRVTNDVYALGELFSQGFAAIFVNLIEMFSIFVSMAVISWAMTGITLAILPLMVAICLVLSRKIRIQFGATKRKLAMINAFSAESLGGIKVLQLFGRTAESRRFFDQLSREYRELQISTIRIFAMLWPVVEGFNIVTLAIALFVGAYFHQDFGLSMGELSAYILLLQGFFKPVKTILERYNQLQNSLASADRVFHLFDEATENREGRAFAQETLEGRIEMHGLSFRYAPNAPYVLKNINLKVEPGMSVALVGRTGSGKSSLISLLQKLYEIEEGDIRIDGISIRELAPQDLRPRIGVVQQDGFVFSGTILSNVTLGDPRLSRERALWACEHARCQDILRKHGGIDGRIQERGSNLSAGERQLLAFARVLAFDPDILILDEATANIDSISERQIQKATEMVTRGRTSVIIAHRLSTILHCDLIVVLDKGEIVEAGRHEDLLRAGGRYQELHSLQFGRQTGPAEALGGDTALEVTLNSGCSRVTR